MVPVRKLALVTITCVHTGMLADESSQQTEQVTESIIALYVYVCKFEFVPPATQLTIALRMAIPSFAKLLENGRCWNELSAYGICLCWTNTDMALSCT